MKDISNKPLSWTGTHPLERLYLDVKARAERAEAEAAAYRARLDAAELAAHEWREKYAAAFENYRNTEYWLADLQRAHEISEELVDQLRAQLDAARAELAALKAAYSRDSGAGWGLGLSPQNAPGDGGEEAG